MDNIEKIKDLITKEQNRQENEICLIASENYMSEDVINACGSALINKYSEGNVGKRYYGGCQVIDEIEQIAIDEAKELFRCEYANVQPNSGCQANQAVYMALCNPNDTILGMDVNSGGHISHTLKIGFAGTFYNSVSYGLDDNGIINYDEIKAKLYEYKPRLLIVGGSAYPREIDFKKIRDIVNEYNKSLLNRYNPNIIHTAWCVNGNEVPFVEASLSYEDMISCKKHKCLIMVDMAHIAGLVATGEHMSPFPYADVVTSTVQKTLRSGRGGIILTNDEEIAKKIDKAVFPRLQGGPLNNMIAGKAIGFAEALKPEFKQYIQQVKKNIQAMVEVFQKRGVPMVSGGSDNHLILLDLRKYGISGQQLEDALSEVGIIVNKNAVKDDPLPKSQTSGIRLGTAAITTRGLTEDNATWLAHQICHIIDILTDEYDYEGIGLHKEIFEENLGRQLSLKEVALLIIKDGVENLCLHHPIYKK